MKKSNEVTTTKRTGNPIQMLARGQLPHPKLTVEVKETRIEGFKIIGLMRESALVVW